MAKAHAWVAYPAPHGQKNRIIAYCVKDGCPWAGMVFVSEKDSIGLVHDELTYLFQRDHEEHRGA